jgi:hypothetical protein
MRGACEEKNAARTDRMNRPDGMSLDRINTMHRMEEKFRTAVVRSFHSDNSVHSVKVPRAISSFLFAAIDVYSRCGFESL